MSRIGALKLGCGSCSNSAVRLDLPETPLVIPTREYFPPTETVGAKRGSYVFSLVKQHMGMADWPCELEFFDRPEQLPASIASGLIRSNGAPSGTFQIRRSQAVIAYASDLLEQPRQLIATFAHELAHYLLSTARTIAPGGEEVHELTTELAVAYAGFAVFGANHAFRFSQQGDAFSQGWQASRSGYFSERTWAFNLVVFTRTQGRRHPVRQTKASGRRSCQSSGALSWPQFQPGGGARRHPMTPRRHPMTARRLAPTRRLAC